MLRDTFGFGRKRLESEDTTDEPQRTHLLFSCTYGCRIGRLLQRATSQRLQESRASASECSTAVKKRPNPSKSTQGRSVGSSCFGRAQNAQSWRSASASSSLSDANHFLCCSLERASSISAPQSCERRVSSAVVIDFIFRPCLLPDRRTSLCRTKRLLS